MSETTSRANNNNNNNIERSSKKATSKHSGGSQPSNSNIVKRKQLSFFPNAEDDSEPDEQQQQQSESSLAAKLNGKTLSKDGLDSETNILTKAIRVQHHHNKSQLAKESSKDADDEASSTGSCSCEDHSSAAEPEEEEEDDPHGNLDYDEDSITSSPANELAKTNGLGARLEKQQESDLGAQLEQSREVQIIEKHMPDCNANKSNNEDDDQSESSDNDEGGRDRRPRSRLQRRDNKLKSFVRMPALEAEQQQQQEQVAAKAPKPAKDRSHKSYHGLLKYFFKDACYFQIKSINHENVELSKSMGVWSTPLANEMRLNAAFAEHRNVILIFSVQQSGAFQGFARLTSEARPAERGQPIAWVLPERLSRANLGGVFQLDWLCAKELNFDQVRELRNPLNGNKPIKVARDGQQVEARVGQQLCCMFARDSKKRLLGCVETLKEQVRRRKQSLGHFYQPMAHLARFDYAAEALHYPLGVLPAALSYHPLMNGYSPHHRDHHHHQHHALAEPPSHQQQQQQQLAEQAAGPPAGVSIRSRLGGRRWPRRARAHSQMLYQPPNGQRHFYELGAPHYQAPPPPHMLMQPPAAYEPRARAPGGPHEPPPPPGMFVGQPRAFYGQYAMHHAEPWIGPGQPRARYHPYHKPAKHN